MSCRPEGLTTCRKCKRETPPDALYCPYCGASIKPTRNKYKRGNGQGNVYQRGKTWTARVTIGSKIVEKNGKLHKIPIRVTKGGFKKKSDALDYCAQLKKEAQQARNPEKPKLTMCQIYDLWNNEHADRVVKSTMNCYRAAWKYFKPLHDIPFEEIDLDDLQECVDDCPRGKRTKENMKALAGLLCKYAIPRHQTDLNYAEYINTGNDKKGTRPAFTAEQIEIIRQHVGKTPHADYVYCMIYTGFRTTEFVRLKKENYIDGVLYAGIKTEAGMDRAVPVSDKIKAIIDARASMESEYLFPKDNGQPMSANYFRDVYFYQVLADVGIQELPTESKPAYYVPYSARHAFANLLKDVPGSDKDKAGLIGHEDYKTTKRHYQSVELDALKAIVKNL